MANKREDVDVENQAEIGEATEEPGGAAVPPLAGNEAQKRVATLLVYREFRRYVTRQRKSASTKAVDALIKGMQDVQRKLLDKWIQRKLLDKWSTIFVMLCVFAVLLDPLFFYILIIDQDNKCLQMDKKMRTIVLVLRSFTDIIFVMDFTYKIYYHVKVQKISWLSFFSIINDFLALLPVPQLLIVVIFYHMRGAEYVEHRTVLNVFIIGQYLPRIYRIHQSSEKLRWNAGIWVKGLLYFFLYMVASHILGAFWYFFSIQQETLCWHNACTKHSPDPVGCMNTFYCGRRTTASRNITLLNKHCPLDTPDGALPPFNFGIFLDSLKNHNVDNIKFEKKFFYSFWWGLRNLSNFGTNLTTSTYVMENLFAILISALGLLLFLYLIGNVQTFIQMAATKQEEMRQRKEGGKIFEKYLQVEYWMEKKKFPDDIKKDIWNTVGEALKKDIDADVHNPFLILPSRTKRSVKRHLFMDTLRKVKMLKGMNEEVLIIICDSLKPVTYSANNFIFRMGDPLDFMLFIVDGVIWSYVSSDSQAGNGTSSMVTKPLRNGQFYGEELLDWAADDFTEVPVSSKHVKSQTKVEAFVLMATDLQTVVSSNYSLLWRNRGFLHINAQDDNGEILPYTAGN